MLFSSWRPPILLSLVASYFHLKAVVRIDNATELYKHDMYKHDKGDYIQNLFKHKI